MRQVAAIHTAAVPKSMRWRYLTLVGVLLVMVIALRASDAAR